MGDRSHPRRLGAFEHPPPTGAEITNDAPKRPEPFDPARHGFAFKNPLGLSPPRAKKSILRRLDPFIYGNGLCLGMAAAALREFSKTSDERRLSELSPSPETLDELFALHTRQFRPKAILAVVRDWLRNGGGKPGGVPNRLRLPEVVGGDPHILCFGPGMNRSFLRCMKKAHAVAPYRVESSPDETRVFVYDPNYPKSRGRYISFGMDGGFRYGGFSSGDGWGITLLPLSAIGEPPT